ncbi:MAG: ATP-binding protein [Chitinophagaceae bacterium]
MKINLTIPGRNKGQLPAGLSLRKKLPLLICVLLLFTIIAFGTLCYFSVRTAAMTMGKDRLSVLTNQLGAMFGQSALQINTATHVAGAQLPVKQFLLGGTGKDSAVLILDKLRIDSTWPQADLLAADGKLVLRSGKNAAISISGAAVVNNIPRDHDSSWVGKIYQSGESVIYPIITTVMDNRKTAGYLVRWRLQTATPESVRQLSRLLGTNAQLYFGNRDGSLWTNVLETTDAPPVAIEPGNSFFEYSRPGKNSVIAASAAVPGSEWIILVEFPKDILLTGAHLFLRRIIVVGLIVILSGCIIAWIISSRITIPLEKITLAAASIAEGHYNTSVIISRGDELGKLARAFNDMGVKLKAAQQGLEEQVHKRTIELENVNRELEAFSYSVSHDLRAPLRSINGYAAILEEDYASKLDAEAMRLTGKIISNGKKMGLLIDDLIAFSQVARKDIKTNIINMQALVKSCEDEVLVQQANTRPEIKTGVLPPARGDESLIRQVWINLISNAIKYSSREAHPVIEIGYQSGDKNYYIKDNGAGFDMAYADKLFGVFQRLHSSKDFDGTGIGLALTKRIIDRHRGHIHADAKVNEGACFYFNLPG